MIYEGSLLIISDGITIPNRPPSLSKESEARIKGTQALVCLVNFKPNVLNTVSVSA